MKLLVRACLVLAALSGVALAAQEPLRAREVWERLPHAERAELLERYEKFRSLPAEERAKLVERAKRLEGLRSELVKDLPPDVRARLERMTPLERLDALREFLEHRLESRGRHVRGFLPRELRERMESAPPESREGLVREYCDRARRDHGRRMLESLGRRLELDDAEIQRIDALPETQRFEALMDLKRHSIELEVAEEGLPSWLDETEWAAMGALPTREFFERFHGLRRDRCGSDHDGGPGGPRFHRAGSGERGPGGSDLLEPDPRWRQEAEKLPPSERRAWLEERMRERVLDRLAARPDLITPEALAALRAKRGAEFQAALREALGRGSDGRERSERAERR